MESINNYLGPSKINDGGRNVAGGALDAQAPSMDKKYLEGVHG
jgi:hypothetical protein